MKLIIFISLIAAPLSYSQTIDSVLFSDENNWDIFNDLSTGVYDIWVENDSNYWLATGGPTFHVLNNEWLNQELYSNDNDSIGYNVNQIFFSPFSSKLWFGSNYSGITSYKDSMWQSRVDTPLSNNSHVDLILEDKYGNVLVWGTNHSWGRDKFYETNERFILNDERQITQFTPPIKSRSFTVPNIDHQGYFTMLSEDLKFVYKNGKWEKSKLPDRIEIGPTIGTAILRTLYTETGNIWIYQAKFGTQKAKLIQIKKREIIEHEVHPEMNSSIGLGELAMDSEGRVWVCLRSSGYWIYDGQNWTNLNSTNSPIEGNNFETFHIFNKSIWFGTNKGLFLYHSPNE